MRLRACDHYTLGTLIGGKSGASPSSLHTNGVCECKMDVKSTWSHTWHEMYHVYGHLDYFQKPPLEGRPNMNPGDHNTLNAHNICFILFCHARGPT
jgi:hypothetical protein